MSTFYNVFSALIIQNAISGFPWRLQNRGNGNGHGKVMEHKRFAKNHGIF